MIGDGEGEVWFGDRSASLLHLAESMKRAFVHVMAIDPEQRRAVVAAHDLMRSPQLVDQGLGFAHLRQVALAVAGFVGSAIV